MVPEPAVDSYLIRPMHTGDLDAVMEIERRCFPMPWSRELFVEELSRRWAHLEVLLAQPQLQVVAFCNYWRVVDEVEILNLATHPDQRRHGFGTRLLEHVLAQGRQSGAKLVKLEVRRSNSAAQRIYQRAGFQAAGMRAAYYADNQEDAILMNLDLR